MTAQLNGASALGLGPLLKSWVVREGRGQPPEPCLEPAVRTKDLSSRGTTFLSLQQLHLLVGPMTLTALGNQTPIVHTTQKRKSKPFTMGKGPEVPVEGWGSLGVVFHPHLSKTKN